MLAARHDGGDYFDLMVARAMAIEREIIP